MRLLLDALTTYLGRRRRRPGTQLRTWNLGAIGELHRADLYQERAAGLGLEDLD